MWVFTENGFVSVIATKSGSDVLRVRARDRQSLENIAAQFNIVIDKSPERDYPYRVELNKEQFAQWLMDVVSQLDYTNFKSHMSVVRDYEFVHALSQVWSVMHDVEDSEARVRR